MKRQSVIVLFAACFVLFLGSGCSNDQDKINNYIKEGKAYFEKKEYGKARIQFLNAIELDPKHLEAHKLLGKSAKINNDKKLIYQTYLNIEELAPENIEAKLELATITLLAGRYTETQNRVDFVLKKEPDNIRALYLAASILSKNGKDLKPAEDVYKQILTIDDRQIPALIALSRIFSEQKEWDKAQLYTKRTIEADPTNITFYKNLYLLYIEKKDLTAAEQTLITIKNKFPDTDEPSVLLGVFYTGQKKYELAERFYLAAIEIKPANWNTHLLLAKMYMGNQEAEKAKEQIQKAVSIDPENYQVKTLQADYFFFQKDLESSETILDEVLANRPNYARARSLKGKILLSKNQFLSAAELFQSLVKEEPNSPELNFLAGLSLFKAKDLNQAQSFFSTTLSINPFHYRARLMIAQIYFFNRDFFNAQSEIEKVLRAFPDNFDGNLLLGNIYMAQKHEDKAEKIFTRLIQLNPEHPEPYYRMGVLRKLQKVDTHALDYFDKAITKNPDRMDAFSNLISIYTAKEKFDIAIDKCQSQLKKTDNLKSHAVIYTVLGKLYQLNGKLSDAETAFKTAIDKKPDFVSSYHLLAALYLSQGKVNRGMTLYKDILKKQPNSLSTHLLLANQYLNQSQNDLAENHYQSALTINRYHVPALNNLAFLYAQNENQLNKALDLARRAKEINPGSAAVMDTLGYIFYKKGIYKNALNELETSVKLEPENPKFLYHLGLVYYKTGEYGKAEKCLTQALEIQKDFDGSKEATRILKQL